MRTFVDKYCDPEARYTAEYELRDFRVTDRSVVRVDISCFAPTRAKAISDLKKTIEMVIAELQEELE